MTPIPPTNKLLDSFSYMIILPYILHPTRVTGHSITLTDNIFSDHISKEVILGNLMSVIFDHLPQFLIMPSIYLDPTSSKSNVYERSWSIFNKEEFILDYFEEDRDLIPNVEKNDVNHFFDNILLNSNGLLGKFGASFEKVSRYQLKLKTKPWITAAIHKSMSVKNSFFRKNIKLQNTVKKTKTHDKYKYYKNLPLTVIKKSFKKIL